MTKAASGRTMGAAFDAAALARLGRLLRAAGYAFSTVTPATQVRVNAREGNDFAVGLAGVFGWSRPFRPEVVSAEILSAMRQANVLETEGALFRSSVRFSTLDDLLFVHSAFPSLAADAVFFGPDSVRFVQLIRRRLASFTQPLTRAVDIGCGAGPGAVAIARARPSASVSALDINESALRFASVNSDLNGVSHVAAAHSDILRDIDGEFDLIVANPPYLIDPRRRAYRHGGGHYGEGLSLDILRQALPRLSDHGALVLYTGSAIRDGRDVFKTACLDILAEWDAEFSYEELDPDVFGEELETEAYGDVDRIAVVALTVNAGGLS
jgi:SAM-dependent methyltransferase